MPGRGALLLPVLVFVAWISSIVGSEATVLDIALTLGFLVTLAAVFDWRIGLVAVGVAALSLNYFQAEPRHSFFIQSAGDVVAVVILATVGITVSVIARAFVRRELLIQKVEEIRFQQIGIVQDLSSALPVTAVWARVVDAADVGLDQLDIRRAFDSDIGLPRLSRWSRFEADGEDESSSLVTIPPLGALVEFRDPRVRSNVVIQPRNSLRGVTVSRRTLDNFLNDLELVIECG